MLSVAKLIELGVVDDECEALDAFPLEWLAEFNGLAEDWDE